MLAKRRRALTATAVMLASFFVLFAHAALAAGASYYVNCSAPTNGNGSSTSPWNNLTTVDSQTFQPGDSLLFDRGTTCAGSFVFKSSGTASSPITVDAYGSGALPIIDGTGQSRAIKIVDSSYVVVQNLEATNSQIWGVLVTTDTAGLNESNITLRNLVVHHIINPGTQGPLTKWTGAVVVAAGVIQEFSATGTSTKTGSFTPKSRIDNVTIDNVQAYDTTQWSGIMVYGVNITGDTKWSSDSQNTTLQDHNVTIENSTAYSTYGEGIAEFMVDGGTIQSSVAHDSGNVPEAIDNPDGNANSTPVGLWWWSSENMIGQSNESYDNHSPTWDGGGFDEDYHSTNSTMQYNYGHGNNTYCIGFFGYNGANTTNIFRYNICAGDGVSPTYTYNGVTSPQDDAEIEVCTWSGGSLANTWIYNNDFYITSTGTNTGLIDVCTNGTPGDSESGGILENNLVVSTTPSIWGMTAELNNRTRDYNLWYYTAGNVTDATPEAHGNYNQNPLVNSLGYDTTGLPTTQWALQSGSPAIDAGTNVCTGLTGCTMGSRDFFGNAIPQGSGYDIGADESSYTGTKDTTQPTAPTNLAVTGTTSSSVSLSWTASTDNVGVSGYQVFRNGTQVGTTTSTTYTDSGLAASTTYTYTVKAYDAASNVSAASNSVNGTTQSSGGTTSTVMHVVGLLTTDLNGNPLSSYTLGQTIYWRVEVVDANGIPVPGATVKTTVLQPSGKTWITPTATTGPDGWALFSHGSGGANPTGTYTIDVTSVTLTGDTYNSSANTINQILFTLN